MLAAMTNEPNAASVALIENGRVLLIQRARPPYRHLWTLPGGRREAGETAAQCAAREVLEELGLSVRGLLPVTTMRVGEGAGPHWQLAVFATTDFAGAIAASEEIEAQRWVTLAELAAFATTPGLAETLALAFGVIQQQQAQQ